MAKKVGAGGLVKYKDVSSSDTKSGQLPKHVKPLFQIEKCRKINEKTGKMEDLKEPIILNK